MFFSKSFLMKIANKNNTSFENNVCQNDHLSCHIMGVQHFSVSRTLLCPAHYCVQHIIVSSIILCPHLPKGSFVHLSHFNVLRSYHAAIAKHLRLIKGFIKQLSRQGEILSLFSFLKHQTP